MNYSEFFQNNGYVYLNNFLDKQVCQQYVDEFKKLIEEGKTKKDFQCPLSHSIGQCALFDSLLEQLTSNMEKATGKKLYPTYAYARWYAPGDELKIHRDRPSCEISATINLGFKGNQWPIYMGYDDNKQNYRKIDMQIGDAVIYKGEQLYHWREKYTEGEWQAQVFIHYVDANGPNVEWKFDKRKCLAHHEENNFKSDEHLFTVKQNAYSREACQRMISQFEAKMDQSQDALLSGNRLDKTVRDTKKIQIPVDVSVGATMTGMGIVANKRIWNYEITHSNQSEFLRYDKEGHFSAHMDSLLDSKEPDMRKLTCILILNDDFEGGKFYIQTGSNKIYPSQSAGDFIVFPSFLIHGVEPVISGIRRSIVTWLVGPKWR